MSDINWTWSNDPAAYGRLRRVPESLILVQTSKQYYVMPASGVRSDFVLPQLAERVLRFAVIDDRVPVPLKP